MWFIGTIIMIIGVVIPRGFVAWCGGRPAANGVRDVVYAVPVRHVA